MPAENEAFASDPDVGLPDAQFSDSFSVVSEQVLDARRASELMFARQPGWVRALMSLRDAAVMPFGLKTARTVSNLTNRVGLFPVIHETPQRLVAGFDDSHLDFRIIVDVQPRGSQSAVVLTTVVKTHNLLGRAYLATILPFHRMIARAMLRQIER